VNTQITQTVLRTPLSPHMRGMSLVCGYTLFNIHYIITILCTQFVASESAIIIFEEFVTSSPFTFEYYTPHRSYLTIAKER